MNIRDAYNSKAIALVQTEVASNKIAYLGAGLFPAKKKMGLDLKWIKTSKGLPVSLAPSNFDAVSTLRSREGFKITETETGPGSNRGLSCYELLCRSSSTADCT